MTLMTSWPLLSRLSPFLCASVFLCLVLAAEPVGAVAPQFRLEFVDADIHVVIDAVARITGTTFLFDPARVKGQITVLAPGDVSPTQALELLRSALALHGYVLMPRPESTWIVAAADIGSTHFVVRVIPLNYANAGEVARTLSWVAPPGVRIAPFYPTNSVVISGLGPTVETMVDVIRKP